MLLDDGERIQEEQKIEFAVDFFLKRYLGMYMVIVLAIPAFFIFLKPEALTLCLLFIMIFSILYFFSYSTTVSLFSIKKIGIHNYQLILLREKRIIKNIAIFHDKDWICIKDTSNTAIAIFRKDQNPEICTWLFETYRVNVQELTVSVSKKNWKELWATVVSGLFLLGLIFWFS